jgi:hypothetical protein
MSILETSSHAFSEKFASKAGSPVTSIFSWPRERDCTRSSMALSMIFMFSTMGCDPSDSR